ncbi:hypothetical protein TPCV14_13650 [Cutibacterium avidum]|nr:hypothetical protein TPCV14_13650 [Cutibacterium avidum]
MPALRAVTLPEPVTLKRFFVPEWLFILGMDGSIRSCVSSREPEGKVPGWLTGEDRIAWF